MKPWQEYDEWQQRLISTNRRPKSIWNRIGFEFWARSLATAIPFVVISILFAKSPDMGSATLLGMFWIFMCGVWVLGVLYLLIHCLRNKDFIKSAGYWLGFIIGGLSLGLVPFIG